MSLHQPVFSHEIYTPGLHRGQVFHIRQRSCRWRERERARIALSLEASAAARFVFTEWLVEMRIVAQLSETAQLFPTAQLSDFAQIELPRPFEWNQRWPYT